MCVACQWCMLPRRLESNADSTKSTTREMQLLCVKNRSRLRFRARNAINIPKEQQRRYRQTDSAPVGVVVRLQDAALCQNTQKSKGSEAR